MKTCKNKNKNIMTIINVYVSATQHVKNDSTELDDIYLDLSNSVSECKTISKVMLIAGDFNGKVDERTDVDIDYLGKFSRGLTNNNGEF